MFFLVHLSRILFLQDVLRGYVSNVTNLFYNKISLPSRGAEREYLYFDDGSTFFSCLFYLFLSITVARFVGPVS